MLKFAYFIREKLATRLLGRRQALVGKFSKWTITQSLQRAIPGGYHRVRKDVARLRVFVMHINERFTSRYFNINLYRTKVFSQMLKTKGARRMIHTTLFIH